MKWITRLLSFIRERKINNQKRLENAIYLVSYMKEIGIPNRLRNIDRIPRQYSERIPIKYQKLF
jgi:hypothetical protein